MSSDQNNRTANQTPAVGTFGGGANAGTSASDSTGGAFGSNNGRASTSSSMLRTDSATVGHGYTGTSGFGAATSASGAPATTGGTDNGYYPTNSGGFGCFGQTYTKNASTGFGNFGESPGTVVQFQGTIEKEVNNPSMRNSSRQNMALDSYAKWLAEELRREELLLRSAYHNSGRRHGNASGTGSVGNSSGFGCFGQTYTKNASTGIGNSGEPPGTGTAQFQPTIEKEVNNPSMRNSSQNILSMDSHKNRSLEEVNQSLEELHRSLEEELRLADHNNGRRLDRASLVPLRSETPASAVAPRPESPAPGVALRPETRATEGASRPESLEPEGTSRPEPLETQETPEREVASCPELPAPGVALRPETPQPRSPAERGSLAELPSALDLAETLLHIHLSYSL